MVAASGYREWSPHPALRDLVECCWTATGDRGAITVVPDGCVDFLFETGGDETAARLVGAMTTAIVVPPSCGGEIVAVRFRPGGAHPFVGAPLDAFTDTAVALAELGGRTRDLARTVLDADTAAERLRRLEAWLLANAPARADRWCRVAATLAAGPGRVDRAAAAAGVSRQFFARMVRERTGLPPKLLARVLRARRALADAGATTLAALAARHGYADQAHLARDVRELTGRPPSAWL